MKKLIAAVIIAIAVVAQPCRAQDPPAPAPTIAGIGAQLVEYIMQNGAVGTGYGTELRAKTQDRGVSLNYTLETPAGFRIGKFESRLALGYNVTYSAPVNRQHLVIGFPITHYTAPPWVAGIVNAPSEAVASGPQPVRSLSSLWPNLASWKIQPCIGLRPEDVYDFRFHWKRTFVGLQIQAQFN